MIGGMGVDISTAELALEAARLGGVGHISDAMIKTVSDRRYDTKFVSVKQKRYKHNVANVDKSEVKFDLADVAEATRLHVSRTMEAKRGDGLIFINCMEKLTMNAPKETLRVRLTAAGRRHRRHHAGRRPAPGLLRADGGPPALSDASSASSSRRCARCSCSCARAPAPAGCRTTWWWRGRSPAATSASASTTG
jgi:hypothetical protein